VRLSTLSLRGISVGFVESCGEWDPTTRFVAVKRGLTVALEAEKIRLGFTGKEPLALELAFEGARPQTQLLGEEPLPGRQHWFFGNDPKRWRTNVEAYSSVLYEGLYAGVDLRVRERGGRLEYDLLLSPEADLAQVCVRLTGVERLEIADDEELLLQTRHGCLRQTRPVTWEVLPDGEKRPLDCRYRKLDGLRFGFEAPSRDPQLPLVIDPGLEWGTFLGGLASDQLTAVDLAADGSSDVFVAGYMNSADFPGFNDPNFTAFQNQVFIARLDATGAILRWAAFLGGWHSQVLYRGLAAAADGGAVVVGETVSPDFPITAGAFDSTANFTDAFVTRFNATGGLVFSSFLGGSGIDKAYAVGIDPAGNAIVGGNTSSADFPTTPGAFDRTYAAPVDATQGDAHGDVFITRFTPGGLVTYSTLIGGRSADVLEDLEVDSQGRVNIVGWITGHNLEVFPTTADAFNRIWRGSQDSFFAQLALNGAGAADLKYSTLLGGASQDNLFAVAVDPVNPDFVTVAGMSWSDDFPVTLGVFKTTNPAFSPLFDSQAGTVTRFHLPAAGPRTLLWSTYVGPAGAAANIRVTDVAVTPTGEPVIVGLMGDRRFPTTRGAFDRTSEGIGGAGGGEIVARFSADATQLLYSSYIGGTLGNSDQFNISPRLAHVSGNTLVIAGTTESPDFPVTTGAFDVTFGNVVTSSDGFAMRFTAEPDQSGDLTVGTPVPLSPPNGASFPFGTFHALLEWSSVADPSGIDGYEFEAGTQPTFPPGFVSYPGTVHEANVILPPTGTGEQGLSLGTWFWRVRAVDFAGNVGAWSAVSSFTINAASAPPAVTFVDHFPAAVIGGASAVGVVHLDKPAPAGGATVALSTRYNKNTGFLAPHLPIPLTVPPAAIVPAGALSAVFDIATVSVEQAVAVDILALISGVGSSMSITVKPSSELEPATLVVSPSSVTGGNPSTGTVTLSVPAPAGGQVVSLATSHPQAARVPPSVTVLAGATSASFPVTTLPVRFDIDSYVDAATASGLRRELISVRPNSAPTLAALTLSPTTATGGMSVTGTVTFTGPVPLSTYPASAGAIVDIFSSDLAVVALSPFVVVEPFASTATFNMVVRAAPANSTIQIRAAFDTITLTAPLAVSASTPVTISSVALSFPTLTAGQGGIASVNLSAPAPAGGVTVKFTSSNPAVAFTTSPSALVEAGTTSTAVSYLSQSVSSTTAVNLTASFGGSSASAALTVNPATAASRWPVALTSSPNPVSGGSPSTGTVTLNGPAPAGGIAVQLFTSDASASVPPSVTVPAGATATSFTISTTASSATKTVSIWALLNISFGASLTINSSAPPPVPAAPTLLSPAVDATVPQPVIFDWNDVANAASYEIQVDNSSTIAAPFTANQIVTVSQATIGGLPAQRLWWRVRARSSAGVFGPFSSTRRFTAQAAPAAASLSALSVNPTSVVGGGTSQGTVTLTSGAPSGGALVSLSSANSAVAAVPASVTVAAGATTAGFTVTTASVGASTGVTLTATHNGANRTAVLTVTSPPPPASLSSLALNPTSVTGGSSSQGTVTLTSGAPAGGALVTLSSSSSAAAVPASVTVAAGATTANFTVTTTTVTLNTTATITATQSTVSRTASLTVTPAPTGPLPAPSLVSPASDARFSPGANITFDWTDVAGAASYTIQIDDDNVFTSPQLVNQNTTASQFATATLPTRTMWWRARASSSTGAPGTWSAIRRFEVKS
jgi:hypothetical protein